MQTLVDKLCLGGVIPRLDDIDIIKLISLFVLSVFAVLFSVVEVLINRLSRNEILNIAETGGQQHEILTSLLRHPQKSSATIIVAKSVLIVCIVVLLLSLFDFDSLRDRIIGAILAILLIVVVTELIPTNYVQGSSENSTISALRFVHAVYWVLYPFIKPMTLLSYLGVRILGGKARTEQDSSVSPEDLEALENVGNSQELLEEEEREMISRILDLPDKVAREIMVPRTDVTCLDVSSPKEAVLQTAIESRHSRIPVYEEQIDRIIGLLHVKDLLDDWAKDQPLDLRSIATDRPPLFTPESKKISDLFQELRANKQHMAIVVDEYGGTAGILTLEDIIEEIVGEIQDEYDFDEQEEFIKIAENTYSVDGRMSLIDFNEQLGTQLESENADTIGGFIFDHLGRVPEQGSQFSYQGLAFTILEVDERRIHRIRIQRLEDMTEK